MRHYFSLLLPLLLCTCATPPPSPPLPELGTASDPIVYDSFEQVAGIFKQTTDTTYVVNLWATWCKPCREELPFLQDLATKEAGKKLVVVLVSLDTEAGAIARIPAFLDKVAPNLPAIVLTEDDSLWGKTIDRVWASNLPTTIIYRGDLRFIYRRNFRTYNDLRAALDPLIGKK
jgi:thiol-disulfide isomerase/thioredoxin